MGVGMELYFFMTRQLAMLFSVLTLVHLPALAWHARLLPCRSGGAESEACECAASVANILLRMALSDAAAGPAAARSCPRGSAPPSRRATRPRTRRPGAARGAA